jgi:phosphomannomutase
MPFSDQVFRAYDIRGVFPNDIDAQLFNEIGRAIDAEKVCVGNDTRYSSPALTHGLISGLLETGKDVLYTGTCGFGPALFAGYKSKVDIIGYVTASHKPAEWNGYKMYYGDGMPFEDIPGLAKKLGVKPSITGKFREEDWNDEYMRFMQDAFEIERISIALDCGGGAMCTIAPELFKLLELNPELIFCDVDPSFSGRPSDPSPEGCKRLIKAVKTKDFGVAFDGDGDRCVLVDGKGRFLSAATVAYILAEHLPKGPVVCTVADSRIIDKLGRKVIRLPVGHTNMIRGVRDHKAILGLEESHHFTLPQYLPYDDGMLVPLKMAEILTKTGKSLSELVDDVPQMPALNDAVVVADDVKFGVMEKLAKEISKEYSNVNTLDGVRVDFEKGWVLVRASNTGPKIRIYTEADDQEYAFKLLKEFKAKVEAKL